MHFFYEIFRTFKLLPLVYLCSQSHEETFHRAVVNKSILHGLSHKISGKDEAIEDNGLLRHGSKNVIFAYIFFTFVVVRGAGH